MRVPHERGVPLSVGPIPQMVPCEVLTHCKERQDFFFCTWQLCCRIILVTQYRLPMIWNSLERKSEAVSKILLKFRCPPITLGKFYLEFLYEIKKYVSSVLDRSFPPIADLDCPPTLFRGTFPLIQCDYGIYLCSHFLSPLLFLEAQ